jgi:transketolase C-terminal domain/subunit
MTFQAFVGYGNVIVEQIAENLGRYLRRCGMSTFVASADFAWMLPSYSLGQILQELGSSDILVAACT